MGGRSDCKYGPQPPSAPFMLIENPCFEAYNTCVKDRCFDTAMNEADFVTICGMESYH